MRKISWTLSFSALGALWFSASCADDSYRAQMKGLDEQVQEIKSDVLSIDAELRRLEEKLLSRCSSRSPGAIRCASMERDPCRD